MDSAYWERRRRNNEAAKRSRDARREDAMTLRAALAERENFRFVCELNAVYAVLQRLLPDDRLKAFNDGLRALNVELEGHLTDGQVAEDHISAAEYEYNAAATLSLLCHYMEELKALASGIPGSAATNDVVN
ncbi:hypothetical protein HPB52_023185 [Rhipicephalus sanguineus]|uniref:BZIP domain-containing protein n=1 Tax=Rhipicephalus sanguineus TaxID=34632 RepID=A0A9D4QCC6_RHISA|nr:hypothetical protein HPB52_023185 [Rhipicephalus sanguineus]